MYMHVPSLLTRKAEPLLLHAFHTTLKSSVYIDLQVSSKLKENTFCFSIYDFIKSAN